MVRRHLVQKMRFVLADQLPDPTEADLGAFLEANRERYRSPPTVTLDHVYYADPAKVPDDLLARLRGGAATERLGDRLYTLDSRLSRYSLRELIGLMGPDTAQRIFEQPAGEWHGPLTSDQGIHFVRVVEQHPVGTPPFEELASQLRQDWIFTKQGETVAEQLRDLRKQYPIVIESAGP